MRMERVAGVMLPGGMRMILCEGCFAVLENQVQILTHTRRFFTVLTWCFTHRDGIIINIYHASVAKTFSKVLRYSMKTKFLTRLSVFKTLDNNAWHHCLEDHQFFLRKTSNIFLQNTSVFRACDIS